MPFFWVGGLVMHLLSALETGAVVVCTDRSSFGGTQRVIGSVPATEEPDSLVVNMLASPSLGMTETFGMYSWGLEPTAEGSEIAAPLDFFQPGFHVRVVDKNGRDVGDGERGEIIVRGPCVARRLHKVLRSDAFDDDGYYRTHDEGRVDGDRIHFLGRLGDMIKTAGANVAPAEVERALTALPDIAFAFVVGIDDDRRGQVVGAAVVPVEGAMVDPAALRERLRSELSVYKIPRRVLVLDSFTDVPLTPTMKVRKRDLAAMIQRNGIDTTTSA
jgi:acyl-CoA synthetase (AMP-forming)/AMP-acid ligase II